MGRPANGLAARVGQGAEGPATFAESLIDDYSFDLFNLLAARSRRDFVQIFK